MNKEYCSTCACLDGGLGNGIADSYIGDGYCDDGLNKAECDFDGKDCCGPSVNTNFCTLCICKPGKYRCRPEMLYQKSLNAGMLEGGGGQGGCTPSQILAE